MVVHLDEQAVRAVPKARIYAEAGADRSR